MAHFLAFFGVWGRGRAPLFSLKDGKAHAAKQHPPRKNGSKTGTQLDRS